MRGFEAYRETLTPHPTPLPMGEGADRVRRPTSSSRSTYDGRRHDRRVGRRPHLLLLDRALAGRRGRDRRAQRRRRHRLLDLASRVLAHRAGAARQPLRRHHARGLLPVRHPAHALCGRGGDRRRGARRLHRAAVPERQCRSRRDRHRRADPHRRRGAPAQCPQDRRAVCTPSRQDGGGLGRRQPGDRDGRPRLGRGGALDPRQGDGDERRRRRRHLEDRGLRRRPGDRAHRARRRRAAGVPRPERPDRAGRGSRAPVRRRASASASSPVCRWRPRRRAHWRPAWRRRCSRRCAGGSPTAGGAGLLRLDPLVHRRGDRAGHVLRRRRRIHLRPRGDDLRRSRRAAGAGNPRPGSRPGGRGSSARTKASARP